MYSSQANTSSPIQELPFILWNTTSSCMSSQKPVHPVTFINPDPDVGVLRSTVLLLSHPP